MPPESVTGHYTLPVSNSAPGLKADVMPPESVNGHYTLPSSNSAPGSEAGVMPESVTGHYTFTHRCGCPTHYTLAFDGTTCLGN